MRTTVAEIALVTIMLIPIAGNLLHEHRERSERKLRRAHEHETDPPDANGRRRSP